MSQEEPLREWDIVLHHHTFWPATLRRLPILLPILAVLTVFTAQLSSHQRLWNNRELTFFFHANAVVVVFLINLLWHWIYRAQGPKLFHYAINSSTLTVGKRRFTLADLDRKAVLAVLEKESLPPEDWRNIKDKDADYLLNMRFRDKEVKLKFTNETTKQLVIRTLKGILDPKISG